MLEDGKPNGDLEVSVVEPDDVAVSVLDADFELFEMLKRDPPGVGTLRPANKPEELEAVFAPNKLAGCCAGLAGWAVEPVGFCPLNKPDPNATVAGAFVPVLESAAGGRPAGVIEGAKLNSDPGFDVAGVVDPDGAEVDIFVELNIDD